MAGIVRAPAPPPTRPRTLLVGTALAAAATIMVFAGLFGIYISLRQNNEFLVENGLGGTVWFPELAVQIAPGTMMLFTSWISAFTISWAVQAVKADDRRHAYIALGLTLLMGAAIMNQAVFAVNDFGQPIDRNIASLMLYVLYGSFIAALAGAMGFVLLMGLRAIAGQFDSKNADGIQAAALYWYSIVLIYAVLWYTITITK